MSGNGNSIGKVILYGYNPDTNDYYPLTFSDITSATSGLALNVLVNTHYISLGVEGGASNNLTSVGSAPSIASILYGVNNVDYASPYASMLQAAKIDENATITPSGAEGSVLITASALYGWDVNNSRMQKISARNFGGQPDPTAEYAIPTHSKLFAEDADTGNITRLYSLNVSNFGLIADDDPDALIVHAIKTLYNGVNYEPARSNTAFEILPSAARTIATDSADFINYNSKGAHIVIDVTAYSAGSITPTIQGKDPVSGNYYDLLVGNAITAIGTTVLKVYPGIVATINASASDILPRVFRVSVAVSSADSITYSVGCNLIN